MQLVGKVLGLAYYAAILLAPCDPPAFQTGETFLELHKEARGWLFKQAEYLRKRARHIASQTQVQDFGPRIKF